MICSFIEATHSELGDIFALPYCFLIYLALCFFGYRKVCYASFLVTITNTFLVRSHSLCVPISLELGYVFSILLSVPSSYPCPSSAAECKVNHQTGNRKRHTSGAGGGEPTEQVLVDCIICQHFECGSSLRFVIVVVAAWWEIQIVLDIQMAQVHFTGHSLLFSSYVLFSEMLYMTVPSFCDTKVLDET